jgi:hypothetical protein
MQLITFYYPALVALLTVSLSPPTRASYSSVPKDAILLSKVKSLTLRANAQTSHRRVPSVPQLSCEGPGCAYYAVDIMRCLNSGSGYSPEDIEWSCTASLPEEFKLGSTDVICEGYSSRDDPYVLKGSCGVEYRLLLTEKGEERYGRGKGGWGGGREDPGGWTWESVIFVIIFVGVLGWIIYSACTAVPAAGAAPPGPQRPGGFWGGGGGGGGPGGPDNHPYDPPPPYPGSKPYGYGSQRPAEGWRPGFWSGAGLGAGLGYMAGNQGREREPLFGRPQRGNSGFGDGNNNRSQTSPGRSNSNGSSSSARHESTGFGSTSRR